MHTTPVVVSATIFSYDILLGLPSTLSAIKLRIVPWILEKYILMRFPVL